MSHEDGGGLGHKLLSFLPITRHTTFRVRLTIHEVTNIPLLRGKFAVKWKFKNAQNGNPSSFFDGEDSNASTTGFSREEKGKGRAVDSSATPSTTPPSLSSSRSNTTTTTTSRSTAPTTSKYGQYLSPTPVPPSTLDIPSIVQQPPTPLEGTGAVVATSVKGSTVYVPLKDHAVRWNHTVEVVVDMKVSRESGELMPTELKLQLQEYFVHGSDVPQLHQGRFGLLVLNLAEYAAGGAVTRRYLLNESKSNATLKLTIEAKYMSGEKHFKVPPLQRGQAVAGVAGVLSTEYLPSFMSFDRLPTPDVRRRTSGTYKPSDRLKIDSRPNLIHSSSNLQRFMRDTSLQSAEAVIEAIFNPVSSTSTSLSPFTVYMESSALVPAPPSDDDNISLTFSTSDNVITLPATTEFGGGRLSPTTGGGWWRRLGGTVTGTRPNTPPTTQTSLKSRRRTSGESTGSSTAVTKSLSRSNSIKTSPPRVPSLKAL